MCDALDALNIPNATVKHCDAAHLPFTDDKFDFVILNNMIYHVKDPDAVLLELARVLCHGGRLIVSLNRRNHNAELIALSTAVWHPALALKDARIVAEPGPDFLTRCIIDEKSKKFPGNLSVTIPEPVLSYLNSLDNGELSPEQTFIARNIPSLRR
jgi:ubiquinone/menaquinone biosynthesis C-methylase UbiE